MGREKKETKMSDNLTNGKQKKQRLIDGENEEFFSAKVSVAFYFG